MPFFYNVRHSEPHCQTAEARDRLVWFSRDVDNLDILSKSSIEWWLGTGRVYEVVMTVGRSNLSAQSVGCLSTIISASVQILEQIGYSF